jgi:hypothetical protein
MIEKTGRHVNIHIPSATLTAAPPLFAAENNALQMTLAVKEHATMMIPHPEKGASGNGYNLQEAMGLVDDGETYNLLQVSSTSVCTYLSLMIVAHCPGPIS